MIEMPEDMNFNRSEIIDQGEHEARFLEASRLQHERNVMQLSEILDRASNIPIEVFSVRVIGAKRTRKYFLNDVFRPLLYKKSPHSMTSILEGIAAGTDKLTRHGIFSSMRIDIDCANSPLANDNDIDIILNVQERGRLLLKTGTDFGNSEGSAYASANISNTFGGAENLNFNFTTVPELAMPLRQN